MNALDLMFRYRKGVILVVILGIVAGIASLMTLPVKLYPDMKKPWIQISIPAPGYSCEDFRDEFGDTLEKSIATISDVKTVQSIYSSGQVRFQLEFDWNISNDDAELRTKNAMDTVKNSLPLDSQEYSVGPWRTENVFLNMAITSRDPAVSQKELFARVKPVIENELASLTEAESFEVINVEELKADIRLQPEMLLSYQLAPDQVISAIQSGYRNISVGTLRNRGNQFNIRIKRDINSLYDIKDIYIATFGSRRILLKDIADVQVEMGVTSPSFRYNSGRTVLIYVVPKAEGNLKNLSREVKNSIHRAQKQLSSDVQISMILDPAEFIDKAISNVLNSAMVGSILALLVILIFIGEIKNTVIIFISIPLSVIFSFILMRGFGITINLISLSGMTLAVGMIVDASIVVMENIYRHRFEAGTTPVSMDQLIKKSVREIRTSVIASTVTTVCVFLPLSFTSPLTSGILGDLAMTIVFTLSASLLVALFIIPLIAYYLFRSGKGIGSFSQERILNQFSDKLTGKLRHVYTSALDRLLRSRSNSILFIALSFLALVFLILFVFPRITREIIANPKSNRLSIRVMNFNIDNIDELSNAVAPVEKDILSTFNRQIVNVFSRVTSRSANIIATFKNEKSASEALEILKGRYQTGNEWTYDLASYDPATLPLPSTFDLYLRVDGPDRKKILELVEKIADRIRKEDVYRVIFANPNTQFTDEIILRPRYEVLDAMPEFTVSKLSRILRLFINGQTAVSMVQNDKKINVSMNYPENSIRNKRDILEYQVLYQNKSVPVRHFFEIEETKGISQIRLDNGKETFNIFGFMKRSDPAWKRPVYEAKIRNIIQKEIPIPAGYSVNFQNTQKDVNESINSLFLAVIFSIILIYIVLGLQFNSYTLPLIILVTVPLGFIGVILSLFIFRSTVSLNSMLGTILLGGVVVNNAIIMIDFYLQRISPEHDRTSTIIFVAGIRLRPILITTLTTILGMLPIAMAMGDGGNIIQPLGISVAGGLLISTFFTLFMVPVILNLLGERIKAPQNKDESSAE